MAGKASSDLTDDTVMLVAYTVVSLKRGYERILEGGEGSVIVTTNMESEAFASWILARYLQEEVEVAVHPNQRQSRSTLIAAEELKYLRVHFVICCSWPREPLEFGQTQVATLRDIHDAIR